MASAFDSEEYTNTWSVAEAVCAKVQVTRAADVSFSVPVRCQLAPSDVRMVAATQVSSAGCFLHLNVSPPVGSRLRVSFEDPGGEVGRTLLGRVSSVQADGSCAQRGCTLTFEAVDDMDLAVLSRVARSLADAAESEEGETPSEHGPVMLRSDEVDDLLDEVTPSRSTPPYKA